MIEYNAFIGEGSIESLTPANKSLELGPVTYNSNGGGGLIEMVSAGASLIANDLVGKFNLKVTFKTVEEAGLVTWTCRAELTVVGATTANSVQVGISINGVTLYNDTIVLHGPVMQAQFAGEGIASDEYPDGTVKVAEFGGVFTLP